MRFCTIVRARLPKALACVLPAVALSVAFAVGAEVNTHRTLEGSVESVNYQAKTFVLRSQFEQFILRVTRETKGHDQVKEGNWLRVRFDSQTKIALQVTAIPKPDDGSKHPVAPRSATVAKAVPSPPVEAAPESAKPVDYRTMTVKELIAAARRAGVVLAFARGELTVEYADTPEATAIGKELQRRYTSVAQELAAEAEAKRAATAQPGARQRVLRQSRAPVNGAAHESGQEPVGEHNRKGRQEGRHAAQARSTNAPRIIIADEQEAAPQGEDADPAGARPQPRPLRRQEDAASGGEVTKLVLLIVVLGVCVVGIKLLGRRAPRTRGEPFDDQVSSWRRRR